MKIKKSTYLLIIFLILLFLTGYQFGKRAKANKDTAFVPPACISAECCTGSSYLDIANPIMI